MEEQGIGAVAFVDPDGTFWGPTPTGSLCSAGTVWVPIEDYQAVVGLLEAALRRERKLLAGVRA
ncbi:MAG TPA: hypothetical protein VFP65_11285 [Anaeromyxobacteraceae bacterium]|nr:hypothetical protein [Anaeromyxobacteraceae bacterium]